MIGAKLHELKEKFQPKGFFQKYQLNSKSSIIFLLVLIFAAGLVYLFQINSMTTKGYNIKDLEDRAADLREQNKKLQLQITDLRSTERINQELQRLNMVEVARVEYLQANGNSVAVNR